MSPNLVGRHRDHFLSDRVQGWFSASTGLAKTIGRQRLLHVAATGTVGYDWPQLLVDVVLTQPNKNHASSSVTESRVGLLPHMDGFKYEGRPKKQPPSADLA